MRKIYFKRKFCVRLDRKNLYQGKSKEHWHQRKNSVQGREKKHLPLFLTVQRQKDDLTEKLVKVNENDKKKRNKYLKLKKTSETETEYISKGIP